MGQEQEGSSEMVELSLSRPEAQGAGRARLRRVLVLPQEDEFQSEMVHSAVFTWTSKIRPRTSKKRCAVK